MRIELPSGTPAELVVPESARRGVVVVPDVLGLRPLFDDLCARLAAEHDWAVLAPEPLPRCTGVSPQERMEHVGTLQDDERLGDLASAADELRRRAGVQRVAAIGFCLGGMYVLKAADAGIFDWVVSFYGMIRVPEQFAGPGHTEPIDHVRRAPERVLAIIGGLDPWTPPGDVDDLEAAGAAVVRYPEADHGFVHDASRPTHRPDDAADAWRRVVELLR